MPTPVDIAPASGKLGVLLVGAAVSVALAQDGTERAGASQRYTMLTVGDTGVGFSPDVDFRHGCLLVWNSNVAAPIA